MGNKQSIFQMALLGLFAIFAAIGVIFLATTKSKDEFNPSQLAPITVWGPPFDGGDFNSSFVDLEDVNQSFYNVNYVEKNPATYYGDLLEAIATGHGPDLVILDSSSVLPIRNKLYVLPYDTYPLRTFRDTYVEGSEIFTSSSGIYALPLAVDPLILFWNRDLFTDAAIAQVPKDWDTFVQMVPRLTVIQSGADLIQGGIAFGEYNNVLHAKEIMSALFMQSGVSIVSAESGGYAVDINSSGNDRFPSLALRFYTDFSNPLKTVYSWNKTFTRSREAFAANKVAMYAGFTSEIPVLHDINPNLNFDISLWPQSTSNRNKLTYGKFYGVAVLASTRNSTRAFQVAYALAGSTAASTIAQVTGLPVTRRDALSNEPSNPFQSILNTSAIMARGWLEPQPFEDDDIFKRMINGVTSGQETPASALVAAARDLEVQLRPYQP